MKMPLAELQSQSSVPSGTSTGKLEAHELRDGDNKRFLGKGVLKAVENINTIISDHLKGHDIDDQENIDDLLIKLDGTNNKEKLGANAILAVSIAVKKLSAKIKKIPLYKTFLLKNNFKF